MTETTRGDAPAARPAASDAFLAGGGELGERIRGFDWSRTSLGPIERWPQGLRIAVRIMLTSRQPFWIGWGEDLVYLYNDPYKAIVGGKHPEALGLPTREVWHEIWDVIAPMLATALAGEEGTYVESQRLIMERHGYREETYYTFSYSPIPADDGTVGGIICANTDDTQRMLGERQLSLLHELAARTADARTWREVCERAAAALATNPLDLPFALLYVEEAPGRLVLAAASGIEPGHPAAPRQLDASVEAPWSLGPVLGSREPLVHGVAALADEGLPTGEWPEPPREAALIPIAPTGQSSPGGVLVAGLNPYRLFDEGYRSFLTLVAGQISASMAGAEAYEEERRRAEALAELDRAKTAFFTNVSHEFRTPLTLMLGPVENLLARTTHDTATQQSLEVVRRNAFRLLRMVNTVLDFSRASSRQNVAAFRPTDLSALTEEVAAGFGELFDRAGVRLAIECGALPGPTYVDADSWEKIVLNLVSNAFKFTLAGEVSVLLDADGGCARLRVRDTGTGIPADELPHLFERFHRVRNEQARSHEGTGVGLALVRELVRLHGGEIDVESAVGGGTTFTVRLPFGHAHLPPDRVSHEQGTPTAAGIALAYTEEAARWIGVDDDGPAELLLEDDDAPAADGDTRVAVVDDNADMRAYLAGLLGRHWRVDAYPDGAAALEAIVADPPALVVTDVMMPRLDGFGLLAALRGDSRTETVPVVLFSARAGEESSLEGIEAGADDYLVKPFSARELVARVRVNLELARLRAEAGRLSALEDVRSRVITTVSHELRTPVSAIYGVARTLQRLDELDDRTLRELLGVIDTESERLARITNDILTTERLAAGVLPLATSAVDLRDVVADAVSAARARVDGARELRVSLPDAPALVDVDPGRMQQVVTNLVDNALKYSPETAPVSVELDAADGHVALSVVDEGVGIPAAEREQVFQRFYRVDPELTGGVGGSGLGLYICRQLVEAMGGRIRAEANEPGGSRFVVSLPRAGG